MVITLIIMLLLLKQFLNIYLIHLTTNKRLIKTSLSYRNGKEDKIGTINILHNNKVLDLMDFYLEEDILFFHISFSNPKKLIYIVIIMLIIITY